MIGDMESRRLHGHGQLDENLKNKFHGSTVYYQIMVMQWLYY